MDELNSRKPIKYFLILILMVGIFGAGFYFGKGQVVCKACKPDVIDFSLFWDAYNKLHLNFINPEKISGQKLIYGAISGMTRSLGDPYTDFFTPAQAKTFQQDLAGSFEGIGAEVGIKKDQITIIAPLKGSPAEKAGLKPGDFILQIDDEDTSNMTIDEAVNLIRGRRGTTVTLTVFREGWNEPKEIKITRDTIKIDSSSWELKDNDVAYIQIHTFDQQLPNDFRQIVREILESPAKKIVLDLRNDPGGYLDVCQEIAGWFLENGKVVTIEDFGKGSEQKKYLAEGNGALSDYPIVVLINEGSASAAEILAGALRDNRNIKLIGEKSFGKGSVQEFIVLQDGASFLKITVAKWMTPKGNFISEVGLEPDIKVEISEQDAADEKDTQLQKALEIIKTLK